MDTEELVVKEFTPSKGLSGAEAAALLEQYGRNELEEKVKKKVCVCVCVCVCVSMYVCVCVCVCV
jgi:hypothetical protein